jgi:hypothetical protein
MINVCTDCGEVFSGIKKRRARWTFLFWPWNLCFAAKKLPACPECSGQLIPANSPKGRELVVIVPDPGPKPKDYTGAYALFAIVFVIVVFIVIRVLI